jgi:hypothetical protein
MTIHRSLGRVVLSSVLVIVAACQSGYRDDRAAAASSSATASAAGDEVRPDDAYRHRRCGPGVQACTAAQSGQACDPNNLNVICSPQSNGSFCCLAIAQN